MDAQTLKMLSYGCYSLAGIFFVVTILLFFRFHIGELIKKMSGKNTKQQVSQIQSHIGEAGKKAARHIFDGQQEEDEKTVLLDEKTKVLEEEKTVLLDERTVLLQDLSDEEPEIILLQDEIVTHTKERI